MVKASVVHQRDILLIGKVTARGGHEHVVNVAPHFEEEVPRGVY